MAAKNKTPLFLCRDCGKQLPADRFYRSVNRPGGLYPWCKDCEMLRRANRPKRWSRKQQKNQASHRTAIAQHRRDILSAIDRELRYGPRRALMALEKVNMHNLDNIALERELREYRAFLTAMLERHKSTLDEDFYYDSENF